jgi:hypothetical protein
MGLTVYARMRQKLSSEIVFSDHVLNRYEESNHNRLSQKIKGSVYLKLTKYGWGH